MGLFGEIKESELLQIESNRRDQGVRNVEGLFIKLPTYARYMPFGSLKEDI